VAPSGGHCLLPPPASMISAPCCRCCRVIYTNVAHLSRGHKHFLSHNIEFILTLNKVVANAAVVLVVVVAAYHRQPKKKQQQQLLAIGLPFERVNRFCLVIWGTSWIISFYRSQHM